MPLNFSDRHAVRPTMVPRCTQAVTEVALYHLGHAESTAAQKAWARDAMAAPGSYGDRVSWYLLDQSDFITNGSGITDSQLKGSVETALNNHFIPGFAPGE